MYGASYVQAITPNLCLGGECTYMGQQGMLDIKYSGRYSTPAFTAIATVQGAGAEALGWGVDMQYARKVSQKVNLAAELKYGISSGESEVRRERENEGRRRHITYISNGGGVRGTLSISLSPPCGVSE